LEAAFSQYGAVERVEIRSSANSVYAFVKFADPRDATSACQLANNIELPAVGRIVTEMARSDIETAGMGGSGRGGRMRGGM
ncbi:hypothetical protein HDU93_010069, partial [Gonapodya sp. JEL0774]